MDVRTTTSTTSSALSAAAMSSLTGTGIIGGHSYDPNVVIRAADDLLASNDVAGGQTLFQSALLNWSDDARFAAASEDGPSTAGAGDESRDRLREAIATLWIAYAHYLQKARQNKSAIEAYEQAVADPVAGRTGRIWLDYARFLVERNKLKRAQDVYLRALVGDGGDAATGDTAEGGGHVIDEQDRNLLWNDFLEMMQVNKPDLTMAGLRAAIDKERGNPPSRRASQQQQLPVPDGAVSGRNFAAAALRDGGDTTDDEMYDDLEPSSKRPRVGGDEMRIKQEPDAGPTSMATNATTTTTPTRSRTHVVTPPDVKVEETALLDITENVVNDPQFMATWMVRDGDHPPQAPEPPLFAAAPPKLSDPTGKDLLGEDLALRLVERLLEPTGGVTLQVCRGLWMLTGLKEERSRRRLLALDEAIREGHGNLQHRLDERLSVAGAAEAAVRTMNETERRAYEADCNQRRQSVLNEIAWEFRQLLWTQQLFLTKLRVPGFAGPTVDASEVEYQARVCSYLHSAFFLRQRIGDDAHMKMLESQKVRLIKLQEEAQTMMMTMGTALRSSTPPPGSGRRTVSRFSPKHGGTAPPPPPPPMARMSPVPPPVHLHPVIMGGQQYGNNPMQQYPPPMHLQQPPLQQQQQQHHPVGGQGGGPPYMPQPTGPTQFGVGMVGGYALPPLHPQQQQPPPPMMVPHGYGAPPLLQQQQQQQQIPPPNPPPYYHQ
jgi:hypothetical protein